MGSRQRILLVGDYNRADFVFVAKQLFDEADFFFIEYLNAKALKDTECLKYGKVLYWKDFKDGYHLLQKINPNKVVFYFIESYNHVALNVACKVRNIPSVHLEHGVRFSLSYYKAINQHRRQVRGKSNLFKKIARTANIVDKYFNRRFFQNTLLKSPKKEGQFLRSFYQVRSRKGIFDTFQQLQNDLRLPDSYISFSPAVFNFHKELESLSDTYPVKFIGIPQFDSFHRWAEVGEPKSNILFIDQPLHEQGLYGWSLDAKRVFLKTLASKVHALDKKLFIKPHPLNDMAVYDDLSDSSRFEIVLNDWNSVVPAIDTVLGFSSTLLLPFMAMSHVGCIILEIHPTKLDEPYSKFLLDSGACHAVFSFDELLQKVENRNEWFPLQVEMKQQFVEKYMYRFDGKSSERLKAVLLENEAA